MFKRAQCMGMRFLVVTVMAFAVTLAAGVIDGKTARAGYEDVQTYGPLNTPVRFPYYARVGTKIQVRSTTHSIVERSVMLCARGDMDCQDYELGKPEADLECGADGEWKITRVSGSCINEFKYCNVPAKGDDPVCRTTRGKSAAETLQIRTDSTGLDAANCSEGNMLEPKEKEFCAFNYDGENGVTGGNDDGMFRVESGAGAYIVYKKVSDVAKYITRTSGDAQPLTLPTAPGGNYGAFKQFLTHPDDSVKIENACPPIDIRLCYSLMPQTLLPAPLPPIDAKCGVAFKDKKYKNPAEIPIDDLCSFGDPVRTASIGKRVEWECHSPAIMKGAAVAHCYAGEPVNGKCGKANGADGKYKDLAHVDQADFCQDPETVTAKHESKSGIGWTCQGLNGGTDESCWVDK